MRKGIYTITTILLMVFFVIEKIGLQSQVVYPTTVTFLLLALILLSNITLQSYKSGIMLKHIEYFYFFSVSFLMSVVVFYILVRNLTFSTFDSIYFYELKYVEIILYTFALYLVKDEKKNKLFYFLFSMFLIVNVYISFNYIQGSHIKHIPLIIFVQLYLMYLLVSHKRMKIVLTEVLEYSIMSEVIFYLYLESSRISLYVGALFLFLASLIRLIKFFSDLINRDFYRTTYIKEKKANKLLALNNRPILLLQGYTIKKANKASLNLFGLNQVGEIRNQNLFNFISAKELGGYNFEKTLEEGEKKVNIKTAQGKEHRKIVDIYKVKGAVEEEYILEFRDEADFGEKFFDLNDKLENVIYIYEEGVGYSYVSKGIEKLMGYKPEEFYEDKWFTKKISQDKKFENLLHESHDSMSITGKYKKKNGEIIYLKEDIKRVEFGERAFYYGVVTEVTNLILEVERYKEIKEDLEEKNKKKDMAMSIVSHEIRTPITAIIGFLENILINNHRLDEDTSSMIKKVFSNSIRLKELVNNLLDLNKLNAGKLEIYLEKTDLSALIKEIILNNETLIDIKNIKCVDDLGNKDEVYCDSSMLYQIINNVISNSIKYNKENGKIIITKEENSKELILKIEDNGVGIPEENREKVFMEYERVRGIKEKGTGLGLPLAKKLIELNNGKIWFKSEVDKGTTFYLLFQKPK